MTLYEWPSELFTRLCLRSIGNPTRYKSTTVGEKFYQILKRIECLSPREWVDWLWCRVTIWCDPCSDPYCAMLDIAEASTWINMEFSKRQRDLKSRTGGIFRRGARTCATDKWAFTSYTRNYFFKSSAAFDRIAYEYRRKVPRHIRDFWSSAAFCPKSGGARWAAIPHKDNDQIQRVNLVIGTPLSAMALACPTRSLCDSHALRLIRQAAKGLYPLLLSTRESNIDTRARLAISSIAHSDQSKDRTDLYSHHTHSTHLVG